MTVLAATFPIFCPGCSARLDAAAQGKVICPSCRWRGDVFGFSPKALAIDNAESALPEDATCLHHPRKKAIAVCTGTGDYVCALCAVDLNGQTYSTAYLDGAGKNIAGKAFDKVLPRPDNQILLYLLLCFAPYVNAVVIAFTFLWVPHSIYLYRKLLRVRREDPLMRRVVGKFRLIMLPILVGIFSLAWLAGVIALTVYLIQANHPRGMPVHNSNY